ncbi:MAG: ZIP family metal transporter [Nitrososphaerota archaeon]
MIYSGLGFAAGVMLAASFTSLILPGLEYGGLLPVIVGIFLGAFTVSLIDKILPHLHIIKGREGPSSKNLKAAWLFVIAITIHNMPEGFAVGVGFGSGDIASAIALALAIGFQNIPEGLSVGFSLISVNNYSRLKAYIISTLSGFVEAPLAILGAYLTSLSLMLLPYFMGFAAGAMIFVVSDEIIPETHSEGKERVATYSLIIGLVLMLTLDIFLS